MHQSAFAEVLREQRHTAGYSQEELAERAGLSVGAIGSLEQGLRRAPYRETVRALADALGLSESVRRQFERAAVHSRGRQLRGDSGIPVLLTSFVERNEVSEIVALLADRRLLTITGSGGVGKTRVAIEVARRAEPLFEELWFVDLSPVRDGSQVTPQLAARLNVPVGGDDGLASILQYLRSRRALLVIDNCEHVVGETASVIEKLLRGCPNSTFLTTSREPLALSGEVVFRLPSMDVKTASELFATRARETDPKWWLDEERSALVLEVCKELDGIPLAIELVACRVASLGLEVLRTRLRVVINLAGMRDREPRHQTMAATIAWSYNMLSDTEKLLFRRLSVFVGGLRLEAAEEICSDESFPVDAVANALSQLVNKSLIHVEHSGVSTRYRFLEPIRAFASERLVDGGELETVMLRFLGWLKQKAAALDSQPRPAQKLVEEGVELDNVRSAVTWANSFQRNAAIVSAAEVLIGYRRVWFVAGRQTDFRTLMFGLLDRLNENENPELVGLLIASMTSYLSRSELLALSERAIPLLTAAGYRDRAAAFHARCAMAECVRGNAAAAKERLAMGEALLTSDRRDTVAAASFALHGAYTRYLLNDVTGALHLLDGIEVLPGDPYEVDILVLRAVIEFNEGHVDEAIETLANAKIRLARYPFEKHFTVVVCNNLTDYYLHLGNVSAAEEELREAISAAFYARTFFHSTSHANLGRNAAFFSATSGYPEFAARLLGAADGLCDPSSLEKNDAVSRERARKAIEARIPHERAEALCRRGANEDLSDLLEEFLDQPA